MNWGKGILISIIIFMAGIAVMVSISISKDVDLVAHNYYEKEIKYQDEIDRINNTNLLDEQVKFEVNNNILMIQFPSSKTKIKGEVDFYRPSDSRKDFKVKLDTDSYNKQTISMTGIEKGLWRIKIFWETGGKNFLSTNTIILQ